MNHLAHFRAAYPDRGLVVGGFLGDLVKGRLEGRFDTDIEKGIRLHRAIDAFSDNHELTRRSVARFHSDFRRFGPVMVDIIYDHLLATHWHEWHKTDIDTFTEEVTGMLDAATPALPANARLVAHQFAARGSLARYANDRFVSASFEHLGRRFTRANPLDRAYHEFDRLRPELLADFTLFYPELIRFSQQWQQDNPTSNKASTT